MLLAHRHILPHAGCVKKSTLGPVYFLLVDDRHANLLALEALLARDELVLLKAHSGEEALELLLRHEVALALVDVQMPGMDGFDLAELMRGNDRTRHVPIIFVTAEEDRQRRFLGYDAGGVDFIYKPIEPHVLRSKANVFFDLHRQSQQLAAQRDELAAATATLRQKDQRKDEFLAVLAHELRNPVAALLSGVDLLKRPRPGAEIQEIRLQMERMLAHLSRLVEDLLDVSRINEGKISLQVSRIDLSEVIRLAIEGSRQNIEAAGHQLDVDVSTVPIFLNADPTRLAQVLANLLNNAAKYTPAGGTINLSARADSNEVEIRVRDNGVGIAPALQAKIFTIFSQIDDHIADSKGGLGIGLALVKQLVTLHGGTIEVESEGAGMGSAFIVKLPVNTLSLCHKKS